VLMPNLTHLEIGQQLTGRDAQMYAALRLGTIRSLDVRMDLSHAWFLQGCTQLKTFTLVTTKVKGVSAIAQLTGLTQFKLFSGSWDCHAFTAAEQSELGSTLAALTNLQSLLISHAPPGPVTQALSQLTGLTELTLYQQHVVVDPGPLILPSCVKLSFGSSISVQHAASIAMEASIEASQLQHLKLRLTVQSSELGAFRSLCRGLLRACSCLSLELRDWSKEDTVALMAVLSRDWQPSAEALQPIRSSSIDSCQPSRQWSLKIWSTRCSRQCLELLPKGLSSLDLWWVSWLHAHLHPTIWPT
jgi:hypothetical protein